MVDFHKGFENFGGLGKGKGEKKNDSLNLSYGSSDSPSAGGSAEVFYNETVTALKGIFNMVADGKEKMLQPKDYLNLSQKVCVRVNSLKKADECVRLFFENDSGYKENYLYEHSVNVGLLIACIALGLNFSPERMIEVTLAAIFHDIGMMKIPPELWNKSGQLNEEEYGKMKEHPLYGEGIFTNLEGITEVVPLVIGQHEEKVDGSGYPGHLTIDNIHYLARLVALVDSYETFTHTRLWKTKMLPDKAIQYILDNETKSYDPYFVKALLRQVSIFPVGTFVRLSSGEICKVISTNEDTPMRPVVSILVDTAKKRLDGSRLLDLSKQLLVHVEKCIDEDEVM